VVVTVQLTLVELVAQMVVTAVLVVAVTGTAMVELAAKEIMAVTVVKAVIPMKEWVAVVVQALQAVTELAVAQAETAALVLQPIHPGVLQLILDKTYQEPIGMLVVEQVGAETL
jgi:hypothetical protein